MTWLSSCWTATITATTHSAVTASRVARATTTTAAAPPTTGPISGTRSASPAMSPSTAQKGSPSMARHHRRKEAHHGGDDDLTTYVPPDHGVHLASHEEHLGQNTGRQQRPRAGPESGQVGEEVERDHRPGGAGRRAR